MEVIYTAAVDQDVINFSGIYCRSEQNEGIGLLPMNRMLRLVHAVRCCGANDHFVLGGCLDSNFRRLGFIQSLLQQSCLRFSITVIRTGDNVIR